MRKRNSQKEKAKIARIQTTMWQRLAAGFFNCPVCEQNGHTMHPQCCDRCESSCNLINGCGSVDCTETVKEEQKKMTGHDDKEIDYYYDGSYMIIED